MHIRKYANMQKLSNTFIQIIIKSEMGIIFNLKLIKLH